MTARASITTTPDPARPPFTATAVPGPSGPVLLLDGELDLCTAADLVTAAQRAWPFLWDAAPLPEDAARTVGVDVSGLDFVDVSGLRQLRAVEDRARTAGVVLELVGVTARTQRVMDLLRWRPQQRAAAASDPGRLPDLTHG